MVVALTPDRHLVLVKLYRHNFKQAVCELPAGGAEYDGETTVEAAKRELLEETVYASEAFIDLGSFYVLPSETNRRLYYYLALNAHQEHVPKLDNLIEKYFDMSTTIIRLEDIISLKGASEHNITGLESLFGIRLTKECLEAAAKQS